MSSRTVKSKIPIVAAALLGIVHFVIVGIPFVQAGGGGEGLFFILLIDFPLFWLANILAPKLMYNSVAFNFWLFPVGGTIMYAAFGYLIGSVLVLIKKRL